MDWIGWDSLSYADQAAVLLYCTLFAVVAGGSVMVAYALFGFSPRRAPAKKAKRKKKAVKRRKGRR
jgi:hypothetical protein